MPSRRMRVLNSHSAAANGVVASSSVKSFVLISILGLVLIVILLAKKIYVRLHGCTLHLSQSVKAAWFSIELSRMVWTEIFFFFLMPKPSRFIGVL